MNKEFSKELKAFCYYVNLYLLHEPYKINKTEATHMIVYSLACFIREHFNGVQANIMAMNAAAGLLRCRMSSLGVELKNEGNQNHAVE